MEFELHQSVLEFPNLRPPILGKESISKIQVEGIWEILKRSTAANDVADHPPQQWYVPLRTFQNECHADKGSR